MRRLGFVRSALMFDFPSNPTEGQTYFPPGADMKYIYRDPYWEIFAAASGGLGEAPTDGASYARKGSTGEWLAVTKTMVGLENVDNTSDINKPVSNNQQLALNQKENIITGGTGTQYWTGLKTWAETSALPISTATQTALNLKANIASPTFTGTPAAPTANPGTNTTQVATTAFVMTGLVNAQRIPSDAAPTMNGVAAAGTSLQYARGDHVHPSDTTRIAKAGDAMAGNLHVPEPLVSTHAVTKNYVDTQVATRLPLAGGTMTGQLYSMNCWSGMATGTGGLGAIEVRATGGAAAMMAFHRQGAYAAYFGIDSDNQWKVGGWSMGNAAYTIWTSANFAPSAYLPLTGGTVSGAVTIGSTLSITNTGPLIQLYDTNWGYRYLHHNDGLIGFLGHSGGWTCYNDNSGNFTAIANVSGYSDERIKTNIRTIPDPLDIVRKLRGVFFDRTDLDNRPGMGCISQEVQKVLPMLVTEGPDGMLALAYGNLCGLLIECVKVMEARLPPPAPLTPPDPKVT
jgi:Chaperone of endosialidase